MFRCSNSVFRSRAVTVREPIEYEDAPPVSSASIAASICASREVAVAMPEVWLAWVATGKDYLRQYAIP